MGDSSNFVKLETQFARFAELGIALNDGCTDDDLFMYLDPEEMEQTPFKLLAETLGAEREDDSGRPISDQLWMCDLEAVEDHGDYKAVLLRLETMTGATLGLANVRDHVDLEAGEAWLSFEYAGEEQKWQMEVDDDWLDASILDRYDALLESAGSPVRLFLGGHGGEYGQVIMLAALTSSNRAVFSELTGIELVSLQ